jgi:hypothetical protein
MPGSEIDLGEPPAAWGAERWFVGSGHHSLLIGADRGDQFWSRIILTGGEVAVRVQFGIEEGQFKYYRESYVWVGETFTHPATPTAELEDLMEAIAAYFEDMYAADRHCFEPWVKALLDEYLSALGPSVSDEPEPRTNQRRTVECRLAVLSYPPGSLRRELAVSLCEGDGYGGTADQLRAVVDVSAPGM